jgi:hypothetical protein
MKSQFKFDRLNRWVFTAVSLALLLPWPVAYGFEMRGAASAQEGLTVTAAGEAEQPSWTACGKAVGSVAEGALFYIQAADSPADINASLYLVNAAELVRDYRHLILKVVVYRSDGAGGWEIVSDSTGEPLPDTFLTMHNGRVDFTVPGGGNYKVSIDGGSVLSYGAAGRGKGEPPVFYLEIE